MSPTPAISLIKNYLSGQLLADYSSYRRFLALTIALVVFTPAFCFSQAEGNFLNLYGFKKLHPNGLTHQPSFWHIPTGSPVGRFSYHVDCDTQGLDVVSGSFFNRGVFASSGPISPGLAVTGGGVGLPHLFPDGDPNLMHAIVPEFQPVPEYAMVQQMKLVTYDRFSFNVLRNQTIGDSIGFGLHTVFRHHNRKDHWVVILRVQQNNMYQPLVYLVSGAQLTGPIVHPPIHIPAYGNPVFFHIVQSPDESCMVVNPAMGALSFFKFDRSTGQLHSRIVFDVQRAFYRPYEGYLWIPALNFSPTGKKLYLYTNDYRRYPFRYRFYQVDVQQWDSLYFVRNFYDQPTQGDSTYFDFMPASNQRVYYMNTDILTEAQSVGHILDPDSAWGIARKESIVIPSNIQSLTNSPVLFGLTRPYYSHPKRFRFEGQLACVGDTSLFRLNEIRNMTHISWEMGDGTIYAGDSLYDPQHIYQTAGSYVVRATGSYCGETIVMEDSIFIASPPGDMLKDTSVCDGSPITVNAYQPDALAERFYWMDGDSNASRVITDPGWWWVEVAGRCGSFRDSFYVSHDPMPFTGLPSDTFYCPGTQLQLQVREGSYQWAWPDGSILPTYQPGPNETSVTLQLANHCGQFSQKINVHALQTTNFENIDTLMCQGVPYKADFAQDQFVRISWDDGDSSSVRLIDQAYSGSAEVRHPCGDSWLRVEIERERCHCTLYLPTAFTPNGDGLNDIYAPVYDCHPQFFEMSIFDRWGKAVFESTDYNIGWDGQINGQPAEAGFYAVRVSILGVGSREMRTEGTSLLLRR